MAVVLDRPLRWEQTIDGVESVRLPSGSTRARDGSSAIVFDGDDTLWTTEPLYDDARRRAAKVVADAGLDADVWERLQRHRDIANVQRFGLSAERFPTSCVEAFIELATTAERTLTEEQLADVRAAAESVFDTPAPVSRSARRALETLRASHLLVLLTQGDPRVQAKRVEESGLAPLFDEILVVARKSPAVLRAVVRHLGVEPTESWMVGNSLASDVNPAVAVGMHAIWIDAHVWDHERRESLAESELVRVAADLAEVPTIVADASQ